MLTLPPDFEEQLDCFLKLAGRQAMSDVSPQAFIDWFRLSAPTVFPALISQIPDDPEEIRRFLRMAAKSLYADLPIPARGLVAPGPSRTGRNDPCDCGSGAKFKHCCGSVSIPPLFGQMNHLRYVLDAYPKSRLAEVSASKASVDAVANTAEQWQDEGELARSIALLEPYFGGDGPLTERQAPLFNLLMDIWLEMGKRSKREKLIDTVLTRGDRILRSEALQRRTSMLTDKGNYPAAWRAFKEARDLNPNDPALSFLEVTTLLSEGRAGEAQGRAQWWAAFLAKQRDPNLETAIERLRALAKDPHAGLMGIAMQSNPHLQRITELFRTAPAPTVRHQFELVVDGESGQSAPHIAGDLVPDKDLSKLESLWRKTFHQAKPDMTWLQNDNDAVWDNADAWLDLLQKHPSLWFSFDVLDDLVLAVDTIVLAGVEERLLVPMAERAVEQLRITLETSSVQPLQCPWGFLNHRPALRPIVHLAYICKAAGAEHPGKAQRFMELAHWLVFGLNPNDNHGLRSDLSCAFVRFERWEDALALKDRYPDDMQPTLALNAQLAAWVLKQSSGLAHNLKQAANDYPAAVKMLLDVAPKPVKADNGYGVAIGGKYEAWLYVQEMRPFWEKHGALAWARELLATKASKSRKTKEPEPASQENSSPL